MSRHRFVSIVPTGMHNNVWYTSSRGIFIGVSRLKLKVVLSVNFTILVNGGEGRLAFGCVCKNCDVLGE